MQHLQPNTTLQGGKYRIERVLGQGGFGITYRAITKETLSGKLGKIQIDVPVAIKEFFMPENCMRSANSSYVTVPTTGSKTLVEQYRKKFVKEANNLAGLSHPNIVQVIDIFQENGTNYYVMEYLEGGSLRDLVNKNGRVGEEQALKYIYPIGDALSYMHNKHMCHYDIKPSNIMLDKDGTPKLIDFGISKNYDSAGNQTSSTPVGLSKGFAPLEQYEQFVQEFSPQTDIYALGATLYYLLTGSVPPDASTMFNEGLPKLPSSLSASTRNAIEQAMLPRKKDRPQSVEAFIEMLKNRQNTLEVDNSVVKDEEDDDVTYYVQEKESVLNIEPRTSEIPIKEKSTKLLQKKNYKYLLGMSVLVFLVLGIILGINQIYKRYHIDYKRYNVRLVEAAEQGDAEAQYKLGLCYDLAKGVTEDDSKAVEWYTKAAEQGHVEAQYKLGLCYHYGDGVTQEMAKAIEWYTKAAEQGHVDAQFFLGIWYYDGIEVSQDYSKAFLWLSKAAEQEENVPQYLLGDLQYHLGLCYYKGYGVSQDLSKAVEWFTKAAELGLAIAQCNLGVCYSNGYGVTQDYSKAVEWYTHAAEQGHAIAQCNLGVCYENGDGVTQDYSKAVEWYTQAAEQGYAQAQNNLGRCYSDGDGVTQDYSKAVEWLTKAAEQGNAEAQYNLGICYYNGDGVTQDYSKAVEWYTHAAEQDHTEAQNNLGFCYSNGYGVKKDYSKAIEWYTKAAEQGDAEAQYNLGICYYNGYGVRQNIVKAVELITKAADQGSTIARNALNRLNNQ